MSPDCLNHYIKLGQVFTDDFISLTTDFFEINKFKNLSGKNTLKNIQDKKTEKIEVSYGEFRELHFNKLKHNHFRISMFNYLNAIFERSINDLFKYSIRENPSVRTKFITKFIDFDSEKVKQGSKSLRDTKFELMSNEERNEIYLNHFKEISESLPPLINYQFFFSISDRNMWKDNTLKFDMSEIRARRNLLTHRGTCFDNDYVETLLYSSNTSKKNINPQERIKYFFEKRLFTTPKHEELLTDDIFSLVRIDDPIPVVINERYFIFSFGCLLKLYLKIWSHVTNKDVLTTNTMHELMWLGTKLNNKLFFILALDLFKDYIYFFGNDNAGEYLKANALLIFRDIRCSALENGYPIHEPNKLESELIYFFEERLDNPLFEVLILVYKNQLKDACTLLKKCRNLPYNSEDWFLFKDLRSLDGFDESLNIAKSTK